MSAWRKLMVEPQRPARIRDNPHAPWFAVATVCLGAVMGQLDASIVALALPTLQHEFGAPLGAVEWVALAYLLVLVSMVTAIGRVADMAGRKLLYTYGFGVFTLGSLLCAVAPSLPFLVGARVLQAIGAAMLQANSVALIVQAVPRVQMGRAIGVQGAAQAVGLALGPALGGLMIALGGWRWIFLINVPIGLAGLALGWLMLPRSRGLAVRARFDWLGAGTLVPAIGALLVAVSFGNQLGWRTWPVATLGTASSALLIIFVIWERRFAAPMVNLSLFGRPAFSTGIASGLLSYLVTFGTLFVVPFALEHAYHQNPGIVGAQLAALPLALGAAAPVAGSLAERIGARPLTVAGMLAGSAGLAMVALLQHGPGLLAGLAVLGVGLGAFTPSNNTSIMASARPSESGVASGLLNMTRGLGTALGVALTGLVYEREGFVPAMLFLVAIALLAALLAALRPAPAGRALGRLRG